MSKISLEAPNSPAIERSCVLCGSTHTSSTSWYVGPKCGKCYMRLRRKSNPKAIALAWEKWKGRRRDIYLRNKRRYRARNLELERKRVRDHYQNNKEYYKLNAVSYRCRKLKAMPKWLSTEHKQMIQDLYKACPQGYHVDHIVPLKGDNVSGLHVPWNLQVIPAIENLRKNNRF